VFTPQALFRDIPPAKVADLRLTPTATEGAYAVTWTAVVEPDLKFQCSRDGEPSFTCRSGGTVDLTPGKHRVAVYAVDSNGHAGDVATTTIAVVRTASPRTTTPQTTTPQTTPPQAEPPAATEPTQTVAVTTTPSVAAPERLSFNLRYATRNGRLTRVAVTDLTPRADLRVSVKCPKRKRCPRGFAKWNALGTVEFKRFVGKRLPAGAKITVRARRGQLTATQSITISKGA
jgi:hypothetical protein